MMRRTTMEPWQPCRFGRLKSKFGKAFSSPDDLLAEALN